ncbi:MAG: acetylxylan esterase [bacterium]|nr:MAG: acetylxylan esterase [bacterium]
MNFFNTIFLKLFLIVLLLLLIGFTSDQKCPPVEDLPEQADLPDPLKMMDGTPVNTKEDWFNKRRPELKQLFQHYVYGYLPPKPPMKVTIVKQDNNLFNGKATYKEIKLELQLPEDKTHTINLALFVPNNRKAPAPVFMVLNKCGNHKLIDYDGITIIERQWLHRGCKNNFFERGSRAEAWALENTINHGYALATFAVADMDPDKLDWTDGIHANYPTAPGDKDSKWGTIAAWAWGLHRVIDYLETDKDIDSARICVTGWSRRGKAALFAAAMDERIDLVIPHQSGTGGMALSRMNPSESVERINEKFPHWFNDNFAKFGKNVDRLPVDQHLLVALVAPRPLMDNAGLKDTWASPHLALQAMKTATPVYELLGERGIVGNGFVRDEIGDIDFGRLLQYQRDTEHTLNIDYWNVMIEFANRQLGH